MFGHFTNVVFTGQAVDAKGTPILRADLVEAAQKAGYVVHKQFSKATQLLVASRDDTTKAKMAKFRGIPILTYPQFLTKLFEYGQYPVEAAQSQYQPDFYADPLVVKPPKLPENKDAYFGIGFEL